MGPDRLGVGARPEFTGAHPAICSIGGGSAQPPRLLNEASRGTAGVRHAQTAHYFQCRRAAASRAMGTRNGRAAYVIQADLVAELDAVRIAAVFAADADFRAGRALWPFLRRSASAPTPS